MSSIERRAGERRRGRPPVDESGLPPAHVCVAIPPLLYDEVHRAAAVDRVSVPEIIRRVLRDALSRRD